MEGGNWSVQRPPAVNRRKRLRKRIPSRHRDLRQPPTRAVRRESVRFFATGCAWGLDLLEVGGIYDEDGGAVLVRFWGTAGISEHVNDRLHLRLLCANEQCDVAPSQEATGAGDTSHAVAVGYQFVNHGPSIYVMDYGNDQFHPSLTSQLLKALDVEHVDGRAAHLRFDHHRLNFEP